MEQLNIEGKRSGEGFVAHKAMLIGALSRAIAHRVILMDVTLGLRGFLVYLKALGGSNVVKVVPSNGSASGERANGHKCLKVICGSNTSYLADSDWIGDNTPLTFCDVRVSPSNSVKPNIGATELAETLARIVPFVNKDDARPVLQCVNFVGKEGKLTIVSADGFRLAVTSLDCEEVEGEALVHADNLKGVVSALRRAKRARVSFEAGGQTIGGHSLIIDTELIRYKWQGADGSFPDYEKLIPTDFNTSCHFDAVEAIKAVNSVNALSIRKENNPIDLAIGEGKVVLANPDDKGQAELVADTDGEVKVRIDGHYLAQALRACGGMVDLNITNPSSPMLFSSNGYKLVVMPMLTEPDTKPAKAESQTEPATESQTETKGEGKGKGKRKGKGKAEAESVPTEAELKAIEAESQTEPETEPVTEPVTESQTEPVAEPVTA